MRIVVFHTAFIGDIILMLPMIQALKRCFPHAYLAVVAVPSSAEVLQGHPAIDEIIPYDKRGKDRGWRGVRALAHRMKGLRCSLALIPHRSLRSALVCRMAGIPERIGFSTSAGRFLFTSVVPYESKSHEIVRNLRLLEPLKGCTWDEDLPRLYPSPEQISRVDVLFEEWGLHYPLSATTCIALAPGSIWFTKRWPREYFVRLATALAAEAKHVILVGGRDDAELCAGIARDASQERVYSSAGTLSLLESAEVIRRCAILVTNDSAPLHLAVAVQTPVVALFGPTVPRFGFGPRGKYDVVVEQADLACRPCSIHGGTTCPTGTFDCMLRSTPETVLNRVRTILTRISVEG